MLPPTSEMFSMSQPMRRTVAESRTHTSRLRIGPNPEGSCATTLPNSNWRGSAERVGHRTMPTAKEQSHSVKGSPCGSAQAKKEPAKKLWFSGNRGVKTNFFVADHATSLAGPRRDCELISMVALTIHVEIELSCARVQAACEAFARNFCLRQNIDNAFDSLKNGIVQTH